MAERDSRWITIRQPFNFYWPSRAVTHFSEPGEFQVKNAVADFAVEKGYATEGKLDGSARSRKGKRARKPKATKAAETAKAASDAATNTGTNASLGGTDLAAPDSTGAGQSVDPAAE